MIFWNRSYQYKDKDKMIQLNNEVRKSIISMIIITQSMMNVTMIF